MNVNKVNKDLMEQLKEEMKKDPTPENLERLPICPKCEIPMPGFEVRPDQNGLVFTVLCPMCLVVVGASVNFAVFARLSQHQAPLIMPGGGQH